MILAKAMTVQKTSCDQTRWGSQVLLERRWRGTDPGLTVQRGTGVGRAPKRCALRLLGTLVHVPRYLIYDLSHSTTIEPTNTARLS